MPRSLAAWLTPQRLMAVSVLVALATIALKTLAWWLTGSVGLLSDALESFVNLAAATFGLCMVTVAARPPDSDHPFGHDKAEYFSSGFEGLLIIGAAAAILWTALPRLWAPRPLEALGWGLALSLGSAALNGLLAVVMLQAARRHRSLALEADARHLLTDVWTSGGVVAGLLLVRLSGWLWLDAAIAIAVALNIVREGVRLLWRSTQGPMDTAVAPAEQAAIEAVLARTLQQLHSDGAVRFDHAMTRQAGRRRFLSVHLHAPADWTLGQADALRRRVESALAATDPALRVTIQLLPVGAEPLGELPPAAPTAAGTSA